MGSWLSSKEHRMYPEMVVTELKSTLGAAAGGVLGGGRAWVADYF